MALAIQVLPAVRNRAGGGQDRVLLDNGVAYSGSTVFVAYVPTEGMPFTVLKSHELESGISKAGSPVDCRTEDGIYKGDNVKSGVDTAAALWYKVAYATS